jgi:hypothetical protein
MIWFPVWTTILFVLQNCHTDHEALPGFYAVGTRTLSASKVAQVLKLVTHLCLVLHSTSLPHMLLWHAPAQLCLYFYLNNAAYWILHSLRWFLFRISKSQAVSVWGYAFGVNNWYVQNIQCWDWKQIVPYQPDSCNWGPRCDYSHEKCWSRWGCVLETHYFNICSGNCVLVSDFNMSWPFHMQPLSRVMKWVVPRLVTLVDTVRGQILP